MYATKRRRLSSKQPVEDAAPLEAAPPPLLVAPRPPQFVFIESDEEPDEEEPSLPLPPKPQNPKTPKPRIFESYCKYFILNSYLDFKS